MGGDRCLKSRTWPEGTILLYLWRLPGAETGPRPRGKGTWVGRSGSQLPHHTRRLLNPPVSVSCANGSAAAIAQALREVPRPPRACQRLRPTPGRAGIAGTERAWGRGGHAEQCGATGPSRVPGLLGGRQLLRTSLPLVLIFGLIFSVAKENVNYLSEARSCV